jgi:uncharacterized small protein (DUF1192 family)
MMSCSHGWHGWHGCGPWYGPPAGAGWYEPADWYEEAAPMPRRQGRYPRFERESSAGELEARLAELRDEVHRMESELSDLRRQEASAPEGP